MTIFDLKISDLVADDAGSFGKVIGFQVYAVVIEWDSGKKAYTDEELREHAFVLVEDAGG